MWFHPGDVVRLKSGGPEMTVVKGFRDGSGFPPGVGVAVECQWFAGDRLEFATFPSEFLVVVEEPDW